MLSSPSLPSIAVEEGAPSSLTILNHIIIQRVRLEIQYEKDNGRLNTLNKGRGSSW
jgi:hypothetical protein